MKNKIKLFAVALCMCFLMSACTEADKVNTNISKQADYFECERRITVYNARTDMIILEAEGYMSISNDSSGELVCTVKTGPNEYIKNYGYPPSTKEICIGISLNSTSSVREHLRKLELLGKIKVTPDTSRGIKLVGYQFVKTED